MGKGHQRLRALILYLLCARRCGSPADTTIRLSPCLQTGNKLYEVNHVSAGSESSRIPNHVLFLLRLLLLQTLQEGELRSQVF